jgi:hypothetical protein
MHFKHNILLKEYFHKPTKNNFRFNNKNSQITLK